MADIKERYRRFREWEQQPHEVAPLSENEHECATCGTHFEGNYCPRCGQSAKIGRYSFKKALLLFLDVWGVGNRGMFRSLRDLILLAVGTGTWGIAAVIPKYLSLRLACPCD